MPGQALTAHFYCWLGKCHIPPGATFQEIAGWIPAPATSFILGIFCFWGSIPLWLVESQSEPRMTSDNIELAARRTA